MTKRYFLVFYNGISPNGTFTGYSDFITNGNYLNKLQTIEQIKDASKKITEVIITNIIELSESDVNDWKE